MDKSTIDEKIAWLWDLNRQYSEEFINGMSLRNSYWQKHPTNICAFKCMDGRIHIPMMTNIPLGIIKSYRNIGGKFNFGWTYLGENFKDWIEDGISEGRKSLALLTYHFSKGDPRRGCSAFLCDQDAIKSTVDLYDQAVRFGEPVSNDVFLIVVGIETDTDSLIFHPQDPNSGEVFTCSAETPSDAAFLMGVIDSLYPDMDIGVRRDLLPLMQGNIAHIKDVKAKGRELTDMKHKEWVLLIGDADWLHVPNTAIMIGTFGQGLTIPLTKAIDIIQNSMASGQINNDGFLVLSSAYFKKEGIDKNRAKEAALWSLLRAKEVLGNNNYSDLLPRARFRATIVPESTRLMEQLPE